VHTWSVSLAFVVRYQPYSTAVLRKDEIKTVCVRSGGVPGIPRMAAFEKACNR